jgi:hypothetical protein
MFSHEIRVYVPKLRRVAQYYTSLSNICTEKHGLSTRHHPRLWPETGSANILRVRAIPQVPGHYDRYSIFLCSCGG